MLFIYQNSIEKSAEQTDCLLGACETDNDSADLICSNINLRLLGYAKFNYFKDNYFRLCEYLVHSVYDSKSLEASNFELREYLFDVNSSRISSPIRAFNAFFFKRLFCLDLNEFKIGSDPIIYLQLIDEKLVKAFECIELPIDWTILGQHCYLSKGRLIILI